MRAEILYHPKSEHSGMVEDYAKAYKRFKNREIKLVSLESVEGAEKAKLYDITVYPAMLVLQDNGQLYKLWQGGSLPLMNEVDSYLRI